MSLDKIAELYSIWKSSGRFIYNSTEWIATSEESIPPNFLFKIIQLFSKQPIGNNIGVIKDIALKELVKFPGRILH